MAIFGDEERQRISARTEGCCVVYSLLAGSRWASSRLSVFVPPRAASAADQAMIAVPRTRSAVLSGGIDALSQPFLTYPRVCDGPTPPHGHSAPAAGCAGTAAAAPHRRRSRHRGRSRRD